MTRLLGIDVGTSSVKAVVFDAAAQRVIATQAVEYPLHKPAPDRAEQHPDDWWHAACAAVRQTGAGAEIAAVGLSGQMHGTTLIDADGAPVRPAIIWADGRSAAQVRRLIDTVGADTYTQTAGTLPAVGFTAATLAWLSEHEPAALERAAHVLLVKDYVLLRLTGQVATDTTDAAGSGLFAVSRQAWAWEIIDATGADRRLFPPVYGSADVVGALVPAAAAALGLRAGIPVVAGCADQPAQAGGNGVFVPGVASVTTGSGGQVFTPLRPPAGVLATDPRLHVFNHVVPDMYYALGAILAAGLGLRWLRGLVGLDADPDAYPRLSTEAAGVAPGADGLIYLPYLSGERTPHMDVAARGAFIGLRYHHTRAHLARAVMEGVAFALRQCLDLTLALGGEVETVIAAGGGADSGVWRQIQADVFNRPLRQTLLSEQAGVGAALLAGVGAGVYPDIVTASRSVVAYGALTPPDAARAAFYAERYEQFAALYGTLRDDMHRLSATGG